MGGASFDLILMNEAQQSAFFVGDPVEFQAYRQSAILQPFWRSSPHVAFET
jgi:hypothetical protein